MFKIKSDRLYFILLTLIISVTDQLTKYIISVNHKSLINKDIILFKLDYIKNYGAAFNLLDGNRILLSAVSILITILLIYIILYKNNIRSLDLYSYAFILGGTIGNGIDRILKGYVVDFINLRFINFPIFNIADISINIGFILIMFVFIKYRN